MAKYIWRELVIARTSGFCLICEDIISKGNEMVVLGTGPRGGRDWDRAHYDCAVASEEVLDKPNPDRPVLYYEKPTIKYDFDLPHAGKDVRVTIAELTEFSQGKKYEVQVDGVGVRRFSDRRRAEGAAEILQMQA